MVGGRLDRPELQPWRRRNRWQRELLGWTCLTAFAAAAAISTTATANAAAAAASPAGLATTALAAVSPARLAAAALAVVSPAGLATTALAAVSPTGLASDFPSQPNHRPTLALSTDPKVVPQQVPH